MNKHAHQSRSLQPPDIEIGGREILIDGREFIPGRRTGIGRVLIGLIDALTQSTLIRTILLAVEHRDPLPHELRNRPQIKTVEVSRSFLKSEMALSNLTRRGCSLFLSPYPKLPLFGCGCPSVHMIHDILDLTHPAYRRRLKVFFDRFRLKRALKKADLTWYVSRCSREETRMHVGGIGKNPIVRFSGIEKIFAPLKSDEDREVTERYHLNQGYILSVGNGSAHKNLGILLEASPQIHRDIVFVGVSAKNQSYWKSKFPRARASWLEYVRDEDLAPLLRSAFCFAQPSTAEGYGYPPLEAMGCGLPAVVSHIPVLLETTGGNALTADPHLPRAWIENFSALENESVYQEYVQRGLAWVKPLRGRNAWKGHITDIEDLFSKADMRKKHAPWQRINRIW